MIIQMNISLDSHLTSSAGLGQTFQLKVEEGIYPRQDYLDILLFSKFFVFF